MSVSFEKRYPPYTGNEPYVFLCFHPGSEGWIRPILDRLYRRGVRVWYPVGKNTGIKAASHQAERMAHAGFMLFCADSVSRQDVNQKDFGHSFEASRKPLLLLTRELTEKDLLGLGFSTNPPTLASESRTAEQLEYEILQSNGFSRRFMGDARQPAKDTSVLFKILLAAALVAALLFGITYLRTEPEPPDPAAGDTVSVPDAVLRTAARSALGEGAITEESILTVKTLTLSSSPENWETLSLFPNLESLTLSQQAAKDCPDEVLTTYVCYVSGGVR